MDRCLKALRDKYFETVDTKEINNPVEWDHAEEGFHPASR
jgi:hypothetical protein